MIIGLAWGGHIARGVHMRLAIRGMLWPVRILAIALLASYAVGMLVPPTGAGVDNPAAAISAALGFFRTMIVSGKPPIKKSAAIRRTRPADRGSDG